MAKRILGTDGTDPFEWNGSEWEASTVDFGGGGTVENELTDGANVVWDFESDGPSVFWVIEGNNELEITGLPVGACAHGHVRIVQGGAGGWEPTFIGDGDVVLPKSGLTFGPDPNEEDIVGFFWNGTRIYLTQENYESSVAAYDADALAFFSAVAGGGGTLSTPHKDAYNQFVLDAKAASVYTKLQVIYPFIGSTATEHKWNAANPLDTDGANRLTFSGTITHNSDGITPNGSTGYGETHYGATQMSQNDVHMSIFISADVSSAGWIFGTGGESGGAPSAYIQPKNGSGDMLMGLNSNFNDTGAITTANANARGFYVASRTASGSYDQRKDDTTNNHALASSGEPADTIAIGRLNGYDNGYSNQPVAFATIGTGLTTTEAQDLKDAVLTFITALSR